MSSFLFSQPTSQLLRKQAIAPDAAIELLPELPNLLQQLQDLLRRETKSRPAWAGSRRVTPCLGAGRCRFSLFLYVVSEEILVEGELLLQRTDLILAAGQLVSEEATFFLQTHIPKMRGIS